MYFDRLSDCQMLVELLSTKKKKLVLRKEIIWLHWQISLFISRI